MKTAQRAAPLLLLLGLGATLAGCNPPEAATRARPLAAFEVAPDLLVEAPRLALPTDRGGNRMLVGFAPPRRGEAPLLTPDPAGARLEVATVAARERRLVFQLADDAGPDAAAPPTVEVAVGERLLGRFPWRDGLTVPLPADLPLGRLAIDLRAPGAEALAPVAAIAVRPVLPAGDAQLDGDDLVQSPASLAELALPVERGMAIEGTFAPPPGAAADQEFEVDVADAAGVRLGSFAWRAGGWNRLRGERAFRLPLAGRTGFVLLRFAARGSGPAGRWRNVRVLDAPPAETAAASGAASSQSSESDHAGAKTSAKASERDHASSAARARKHADAATDPSATAPSAAPSPAVPSPAPSSPPPPRLVVLYVFDALRADHVGYRGGPAGLTPTWDRLAAAGARFLRHSAVAPNTLPSTKALFAGQVALAGGGQPLPADGPPTLAERFRRAGFATGLFSGNVYVSPAYGLARGFDVAPKSTLFADRGGAAARGARQTNDNAAVVHREALAWLRSLPAGSRAFLYLHVVHPHNPYAPPEPFRSRFAPGPAGRLDGATATLLGIAHHDLEPTSAESVHLRNLYAGGLAYADAELGRLLGALAPFAPPAETWVALTSDHGEELFEHGGVLHGYTLYREMLEIPLVVWAPGRVAPRALAVATDTLDLHRTLAELAGGGASPPAAGRSLAAWLAGGAAPAEEVRFAAAASVKGGIFAATTAGAKVVLAPRTGWRWGVGEGRGRGRDAEQVFDLVADPGETRNLAGTADLEARWLRGRLLAWLARLAETAGEAGPAAPADAETRARLRALGYLQ